MSATGGTLFTTGLVSSPLVLLPMELLQAKIAPTTMVIATTVAMSPHVLVLDLSRTKL